MKTGSLGTDRALRGEVRYAYSQRVQTVTPDFATTPRDLRCETLQWERAITRKGIAAIPESGRNYRPNLTSRSALELACHIVASGVQMLHETAEMKFSMENRCGSMPDSVAGVLAFHDEHFPRALAAARAVSAEQLAPPVDFLGAFNDPAVAYLGFAESHFIHHRGQLSADLRAGGGKVPGVYGGSADEPWTPPA